MMKMKKWIVILTFLLVWSEVSAQNELKRDTISGVKKQERTTFGGNPQASDSLSNVTFQRQQDAYRLQSLPRYGVDSNSIHYTLPSVNYFPEQLSRNRISSRFPYANNYNYGGIMQLDNKSWFSGSTAHTTLPTFGEIQQTSLQYNRLLNNKLIVSGGLSGKKFEQHEQQYGNLEANAGMTWLISKKLTLDMSGNYSLIREDGGMGSMMEGFIPSEISGGRTSEFLPIGGARANLTYQVTNWLTVSGGPYVNSYNLFRRNVADYGMNSKVNMKLSDRINLQLYGTYSMKGKQFLSNGNPLFPENNYGGAVEYRISDRFGIGGGVERTLNPYTGKWMTRPFVYPIFYNSDGKKSSFQIEVNPR